MAGVQDSVYSNRSGFLSGKGQDSDSNRAAYVEGQLVSGSARLGYMMGRGAVPSPSYRDGFIYASGSGSFAYRGGYVNGLDVSFSGRHGYINGMASGSGSRGGYICGLSSGSDYRGGYVNGLDVSFSGRHGYLPARTSSSSDRYGWMCGYGSGSGSSRGGFIEGETYPYTHQEFMSIVIDLGVNYKDYKWYYDWFIVTRGNTTYTVYVRSSDSDVTEVPWEEVEIKYRIPHNKLKRYHQYKIKVEADRAYCFTLHQFTIKAIAYTIVPPDPGSLPQPD